MSRTMVTFRNTLSATLSALTLSWAMSGGCPANGDLAPSSANAVQPLKLGPVEFELKLVPDSRLILIEAFINSEGPFLFLVDTGFSGRACLSENLQKQFRLPRIRGMYSDDGGGRLKYHSGSRLPGIRIGGLEIEEEFEVLVADLEWLKTKSGRPIHGILGFQFFANYLMQLDFSGGMIRLFQGSLPRENNPHILRFRLRRGVPFCWISVGEQALPLLIDSGFDGGISLPSRLRGKIKCYSEPRLTGRLRTANSQDRRVYTSRLKVDAKLAGFDMVQPPVQFLEGYRTGVLGAQALKQFVVTFDRRQQRVHFALPSR